MKEIQGPIPDNASHALYYDHDRKTVEVFAMFPENLLYRIKTKIRPMTYTEILFSEWRFLSLEERMILMEEFDILF